MDLFQQYLITILPIQLVELIAAIAGSYYLSKNNEVTITNKYLVYFLWLTFFIEFISNYPSIAYYTEYEYFGFTKGSLFERNYWLFNIYSLVSYFFFMYYFSSLLHKEKLRIRWRLIYSIYVIIGVIVLFATDIFFIGDSIFTVTVGTILLLIVIITFYFDLLKNDKIISLKRYLPIYISIGLLFFNLCVTPLSIFSQYFIFENELFVYVKVYIFLFANVTMYLIFTIGFLISAKNKPKTEKSIN